MPRKPMRVKKIREDLTEDQIQHLMRGWCLDDPSHPYFKLHGDMSFPFKDKEHRKGLYFKYKDYLISRAGEFADFISARNEYEEQENG